jgi:hypothetical protein
MVGRAQHHDCTAFGKCDDKAGRPGYAVGMNDDRLNIVERYAPLFLAVKADDKKSAISGEMKVIRGNIDNTIHGQPFGRAGWHVMDNDWLTRPRIEDTPEFIDANLTGSHLLEAASSRR